MQKKLITAVLKRKTDVEKALKVNKILQGEKDDKIRSQFIRGLKIKKGRVVHMYYADVKRATSKSEFKSLLTVLGISQKNFIQWADHICDSSHIGPPTCAYQKGSMCDTDVCRGH
jgi:hypothetical protein